MRIDTVYPKEVLAAGHENVFAELPYQWTHWEKLAIKLFFTSLNLRVFFMVGLPANVSAALLAMFSRIKNPRGLRGVFVDSLIPSFLSSQLKEVEVRFGGDVEKFLKTKGIQDLESFISYSSETAMLFTTFLRKSAADPDYFTALSDTGKTKSLLRRFLDSYGHNSIARVGGLTVCFERISIMAAKTIEWTRPGSGYIELSTRYVDMAGRDYYPIEREIEAWWMDSAPVTAAMNQRFNFYRNLAGDPEKVDGIFGNFLRAQWAREYANNFTDLETGVKGETFDVLGNLLPATTYTSVGCHVSGEAYPSLLRHLILDSTPETIALVEMLVQEGEKIGANQFARHFEPTLWDYYQWQYLDTSGFEGRAATNMLGGASSFRNHTEDGIQISLSLREAKGPSSQGLYDLLKKHCDKKLRGDHDKLPPEFELSHASFSGMLSFRGWRDLQRQSLCTHNRTLLTPDLGFYVYPKPAPPELTEAFRYVHYLDSRLSESFQQLPPVYRQYLFSLGNNVGFTLGANLRELEFCGWQRGKWNVNDEVRVAFLSFEKILRDTLPWWEMVSRADMTPTYIFARGKPIPMPATESTTQTA